MPEEHSEGLRKVTTQNNPTEHNSTGRSLKDKKWRNLSFDGGGATCTQAKRRIRAVTDNKVTVPEFSFCPNAINVSYKSK